MVITIKCLLKTLKSRMNTLRIRIKKNLVVDLHRRLIAIQSGVREKIGSRPF